MLKFKNLIFSVFIFGAIYSRAQIPEVNYSSPELAAKSIAAKAKGDVPFTAMYQGFSAYSVDGKTTPCLVVIVTHMKMIKSLMIDAPYRVKTYSNSFSLATEVRAASGTTTKIYDFFQNDWQKYRESNYERTFIYRGSESLGLFGKDQTKIEFSYFQDNLLTTVIETSYTRYAKLFTTEIRQKYCSSLKRIR